jgi:hypothetical protein
MLGRHFLLCRNASSKRFHAGWDRVHILQLGIGSPKLARAGDASQPCTGSSAVDPCRTSSRFGGRVACLSS